MAYDLKITNGTVVDGTGNKRFVGDVAVVDGTIVAVGTALSDAVREVDASGMVVSPGFIDIHTHMDAQILWDRGLTFSPWHGMTTVVMGNTGFGIAPTRPGDRPAVMETLEKAEGMSLATLETGLGEDWGFETFPEYLDVLERNGSLINVSVLLGHTPLRYYVMGVDDAISREATAEEIARMVDLAREGLEAGAIGLSTSKTLAHAGFRGQPVASRAADFEEIKALAGAMKSYNKGFFEASFGPGLGPERLGELADAAGRTVTFAALMTDMGGPGFHRQTLERVQAVQARGGKILPQVSCRPLLQAFSMAKPYPLAVAGPSALLLPLLDGLFRSVMDTDSVEEKMALYRDRSFAEQFRAATETDDWYTRLWSKVIVLDAPDQSLEQRTLADLAEEAGRPAADVILDIALESNLSARFVMGHINGDEDELERLLRHPGTQLGLSDAGAHVSEIYDFSFPTYLLAHWVRDRRSFSLEEAIYMMTGSAADVCGFTDRGTLRPGAAADVVIFDPDTVDTAKPEFRTDLPAEGLRMAADAIGIRNVFVNGVEIRRDNEEVLAAGRPLPGKLLRSEGIETAA